MYEKKRFFFSSKNNNDHLNYVRYDCINYQTFELDSMRLQKENNM